MRGCGFGLDAGNFESEIVQESSSLVLLVVLGDGTVGQDFPGYRQAFAKDQIGWAGVDIRFDSATDGQEGAGQFPEPLVWFVSTQSVQCFLEASVEAFHKAI